MSTIQTSVPQVSFVYAPAVAPPAALRTNTRQLADHRGCCPTHLSTLAAPQLAGLPSPKPAAPAAVSSYQHLDALHSLSARVGKATAEVDVHMGPWARRGLRTCIQAGASATLAAALLTAPLGLAAPWASAAVMTGVGILVLGLIAVGLIVEVTARYRALQHLDATFVAELEALHQDFLFRAEQLGYARLPDEIKLANKVAMMLEEMAGGRRHLLRVIVSDLLNWKLKNPHYVPGSLQASTRGNSAAKNKAQ